MHYRSVAVAVGGAAEIEAILNVALGLFASATRIYVVTVVPQDWFDGVDASSDVYASFVRRVRNVAKRSAARLGVEPDRVHVLQGAPAPRVHDFCAQAGTDLLVVGLGNNAEGGGRLGSVAWTLLQDAPCDVLTLRV